MHTRCTARSVFPGRGCPHLGCTAPSRKSLSDSCRWREWSMRRLPAGICAPAGLRRVAAYSTNSRGVHAHRLHRGLHTRLLPATFHRREWSFSFGIGLLEPSPLRLGSYEGEFAVSTAAGLLWQAPTLCKIRGASRWELALAIRPSSTEVARTPASILYTWLEPVCCSFVFCDQLTHEGPCIVSSHIVSSVELAHPVIPTVTTEPEPALPLGESPLCASCRARCDCGNYGLVSELESA